MRAKQIECLVRVNNIGHTLVLGSATTKILSTIPFSFAINNKSNKPKPFKKLFPISFVKRDPALSMHDYDCRQFFIFGSRRK